MSQITVPFHGDTLFLVEHNGEAYTPMKPIVDGMGLDWASQFTKLKQRFATCIVEITMQLPGDTQGRSVICMALRKLAGWLYTISPNKVRPELREKIMQYQAECDDVLWDHWSKGKEPAPAGGGDLFDRDYFVEARALVHEYFSQCWELSRQGVKLPQMDNDSLDTLIDGMLVSRLETGRWVLTFGDNGRAMLARLPSEAQIMTSAEIAGRVRDSFAVPASLLPDIAEAVMQRLMVCLPKR